MPRLFSPAGGAPSCDGHALLAPVLVLKTSYEPINVCASALLVLVIRAFHDEEETGHFCTRPAWPMRLPSVNDARVPQHIRTRAARFSRRHFAAGSQQANMRNGVCPRVN